MEPLPPQYHQVSSNQNSTSAPGHNDAPPRYPPPITDPHVQPMPPDTSTAAESIAQPHPIHPQSHPATVVSSHNGDLLPHFPLPGPAAHNSSQYPAHMTSTLPPQFIPGTAGGPPPPPYPYYPSQLPDHPSRPPSAQSFVDCSSDIYSTRTTDLDWLGTAAHLTAAGSIAYLFRNNPLLEKLATAAVRAGSTAWSVYTSIPPSHSADWAHYTHPMGPGMVDIYGNSNGNSQTSDFTDRLKLYISALGQQRTVDTVKSLAGAGTEVATTLGLSYLGVSVCSPWNYAVSKVASQMSRAGLNGVFDPPPEWQEE